MTGAELKQRRVALGLTQKQLADHWDLYQPTISVWEKTDGDIVHSRILDDALKYLEHECGRNEI